MTTEIKDVFRIARNSTFLTISTIINNIIGLILALTIGRYLGKEGFGSYIFAFYFVALFAVFTDLGLPDLITRELARDKQRASKYLGNLILVKSVSAILTYGLILLIINLIGLSASAKTAICIVAVYMISEYFGNFFNAVFNAFERMEFTAALTFLLKVLILLGVLACIRLGFGLREILWVYAASGIIYLFFCISSISTRFVQPKYELDLIFCRDIFKLAFPFILLWLFSVLSEKIDVTILKMIKGEAAVGLYGAASRMIMAVMFIPANLSMALYPAFSRFYQSAKDVLIKYYQKSFQFLLVLAIPLAVGTTILAERFVLLFWGAKYVESTPALQILIWRVAIVFLIALLRIMLLSTDKQKVLTLVLFCATIFNISLNLILIPHLGFIGASLAALLTSLASFCAYFAYLSRQAYKINLVRFTSKPLAAALLMGLVVYLAREINLFLVVSTAAAFYLSAILLLKTFTQEDLNLVKQLFKAMVQGTVKNV